MAERMTWQRLEEIRALIERSPQFGQGQVFSVVAELLAEVERRMAAKMPHIPAVVKDFDVLYRVARDFRRAVGESHVSVVPASVLNDVARQLERLKPLAEECASTRLLEEPEIEQCPRVFLPSDGGHSPMYRSAAGACGYCGKQPDGPPVRLTPAAERLQGDLWHLAQDVCRLAPSELALLQDVITVIRRPAKPA